MFEVRVTVEAPDVCAAVRELAAAMVAMAGVPRAVNTAEKQAPVQQTAAQPVQQAAAQPVQQFTQPAPQQPPVQTTQPPQQAAAQPVQQFTQPAPNTMAQTFQQPVTQTQPAQQAPAARQYTADEIARAGASLLEKGLMPQLIALLGKYNVQSITGLRPDQFPAFAEDLKAMGADL